MAAVLALITASVVMSLTASAEAESSAGSSSWSTLPVLYRPPVRARVVDGFRMDNGPFGAGNRGLEYNTTGGEPVYATANGRVRFAGLVVGRLVVTLEHPDQRLSSVTGLSQIAVEVGQVLLRGQPLGLAAPLLHFGIREDGRYLDPEKLFSATGPRRAYLIAPGDIERGWFSGLGSSVGSKELWLGRDWPASTK